MHNKVLFRLSLLITCAGLILAACSTPLAPTAQPDPTSEPIVVTDALSRSITLEAPAGKVVSLAPSNTEILFALGADSHVVGIDEFSNYPVEATSLPSVGGSWTNYNYEFIVSLQPDLVLAAEINTPEHVQALEDLGLTVFMVPNPTDLEGVYQTLILVGQLTGHEAQAISITETLRDRAQAIVSKTQSIEERPNVFYELDSTNPSAPYTAGPGTFIDLLIDLAGGKNAAGSMSTPWAQISIEELLIINPDIIVLGDAAYGVTPEDVALRTGWDAIEAVKNGQVYPFDDDLASRPGPRLIDGLEEMARLFHPEIFK
jgi:iron complex transport system substrate-binding protein